MLSETSFGDCANGSLVISETISLIDPFSRNAGMPTLTNASWGVGPLFPSRSDVSLTSVYQKVVPPPVFDLVVKAAHIAPPGQSSAGAPPQASAAMLSDIDDSSPFGDESGADGKGEWETLSTQYA